MSAAPLPPYPSFHAQSKLSASQLVSLDQKISLTIQKALNLPVQTLNSEAAVAFITSYAQDVAQNILDALIWDAHSKTKPRSETSDSRNIRVRTFLLAERLASTGALNLITLLDLSIVYAPHRTRLSALLNNAFSNSAPLLSSATTSAIPAFTSILLSHANTGLHGLRKAARTILCFTRVCPPELLRAFAHSRDFVLALAQAYDAGLGAAASSYGRLYLPSAGAPVREPDDWECLFLQTKADLLDAFHILFTALLDTLAALSEGAFRAVDVVLALHALPPPARTDNPPPTAFLNRSLLADYHHAYDLSKMLSCAAADDARLDLLSAALRELEGGGGGSGPLGRKDPGAFTLLIGSGVQHGIDDLGRGTRTAERAPPSGAAAAAAAPSSSKAVDPRVEGVRAILPDYAPEYVEALLQRAEYESVESVVEALLEGTAPPPEAIQRQAAMEAPTLQPRGEFKYTQDRRNVFDGEDMDASRLRIGKKRWESPLVRHDVFPHDATYLLRFGRDDATTVLRDRTFIEEMKADILRRVEEPSDSSDSEEEQVDIFGFAGDRAQGKEKLREVAFDDELDSISSVRIAGDGEESSADEDEGEEPEQGIESILELAYVSNPKVFERDAATRRSKERAALRAQTGTSST
jgi:activating signal cointegrator complex subunit 2